MSLYYKLLTIIALFVIGCAPVPEPQTSPIAKPEAPVIVEELQKLKWQPLNDRLIDSAAREGKYLFVYARADYCGFCRKMERGTFKSQPIIKLINSQYIPTLIDVDKDEVETMILFPNTEVRIPAMFFVNTATKPWKIVKARGYHSVSDMAKLLEAVKSEFD